MTAPDQITPLPWLSLLVVGIPGTLFAATALAKSMIDGVRLKARIDGATNQVLEEARRRLDAASLVSDEAIRLRSEVDELHAVAKTTAATLQRHLIDCAKGQGHVAALLEELQRGQEKQGRGIDGLQRTVANWMRDREKVQE